jgi:primosomal protein N' (replication factor Y)
VANLGVAVIVEEGRKAMKDRQTPTVSVRDLMKTREALAGFGLGFVGPTPTLETLKTGATVIRPRRRAWPPVEIVDRREQAPTNAVVGGKVLAAIKAVAARGGSVFVFAHRRGYAPASRCQRCRTLRRCHQCGSRPEQTLTCQRCGTTLGPCANCGHDAFVPVGAGVGRVTEELVRSLGSKVGTAPSDHQVQVGSEADLAGLSRQDLVVAVDPDGLILGSHYRAAEEALRILARLVGRVGGSASRGLIQTYMPDHPVMTALRTGNPIPFLGGELEARNRYGLPPSSQLLVLEVRGAVPSDLATTIRTTVPDNISVLGPDLRHGVNRFLLQATDLGPTRLILRPLVQKWREAGATVRIDADPLEL